MRLRPQSPIQVLCLSLLVFLITSSLIFESGLFNHLLFNRSGGYVAQMYHASQDIKRFNPGKKYGVLILGSSELRYPIDHELVSNIPSTKVSVVTPRGTTPEEWYYLLKTNDLQKNKYKLIVIGLPYYKATPENHQSEYLEVPRNLANFVSWSDYWNILAGYPSLKDKFQLLEYKTFPGMLYSDGFLMAIFVDPFIKIKSYFNKDTWSELRKARKQNFLKHNEGVWNDAVFDSHGNLIQCKAPQSATICNLIYNYKQPLPTTEALQNTQQNFVFQKRWIQNIVNYYKGTQTKIVFIKLPSPPGISKATPVANAPDIQKNILLNKDTSFIDSGYFNDLGTGSLMHDPYHLSPTLAPPIFTPKLVQIIKKSISKDDFLG